MSFPIQCGGGGPGNLSGDLWASDSPLDGNGTTGGHQAVTQQMAAENKMRSQYTDAVKRQRAMQMDAMRQNGQESIAAAQKAPQSYVGSHQGAQHPQQMAQPPQHAPSHSQRQMLPPTQQRNGSGAAPRHARGVQSAGEGYSQKVNMGNAAPAAFRGYVLYVQQPGMKLNPQTGKSEWFEDPKSNKAIELMRDIEQEVWLQDVADIPEERWEWWLDGTPILLCTDEGKIYRGSQCLKVLHELNNAPKGITWSQEEGFGSTFDAGADSIHDIGGMTESLDRIDYTPQSQMSRYYQKGKVNESSMQQYLQQREEHSMALKQNKPSPAQVQAIQKQLQESYE